MARAAIVTYAQTEIGLSTNCQPAHVRSKVKRVVQQHINISVESLGKQMAVPIQTCAIELPASYVISSVRCRVPCARLTASWSTICCRPGCDVKRNVGAFEGNRAGTNGALLSVATAYEPGSKTILCVGSLFFGSNMRAIARYASSLGCASASLAPWQSADDDADVGAGTRAGTIAGVQATNALTMQMLQPFTR